MAGAITTRCPECKSSLKLKDNSSLGKKVRCPKCRQPFVVKEVPQKQELNALGDFDSSEDSDFSDEDYGAAAMPPVTRKRTSTKKSGRKRGKSKTGSWFIPTMIAGGCVLAIVVVAGAVMMFKGNSGSDESDVVAQKEDSKVSDVVSAGEEKTDVGRDSTAASKSQPVKPAERTPQNNTRPDPIEIVISKPKVIRHSLGLFEVELPYSTVGDYRKERSVSSLKVRVRPSQAATWTTANFDGFSLRIMDGPEGTIRKKFKVVRTGQKHFLDDLKADLEFEFTVLHRRLGTESKSNVLRATDYDIVNVKAVSIQELIARFKGKGDKEYGDIVTISDVPTFATIDTNGKGYLVFNYTGLRLVDCFFSGPGGVKRSDTGKKVTVRGMIGAVRPDRIAILGAYYSKPPQ